MYAAVVSYSITNPPSVREPWMLDSVSAKMQQDFLDNYSHFNHNLSLLIGNAGKPEMFKERFQAAVTV